LRALETAKFVDIMVCGRDLYTVPTGEPRSIKAQMTIVEGNIVYEV